MRQKRTVLFTVAALSALSAGLAAGQPLKALPVVTTKAFAGHSIESNLAWFAANAPTFSGSHAQDRKTPEDADSQASQTRLSTVHVLRFHLHPTGH